MYLETTSFFNYPPSIIFSLIDQHLAAGLFYIPAMLTPRVIRCLVRADGPAAGLDYNTCNN